MRACVRAFFDSTFGEVASKGNDHEHRPHRVWTPLLECLLDLVVGLQEAEIFSDFLTALDEGLWCLLQHHRLLPRLPGADDCSLQSELPAGGACF